MKRRLARFLGVGLAVTAVDVILLVSLVIGLGWHPVLASVPALVGAASASFALHRRVTFADDLHALIDHRAAAFARAVTPAMVADVAVVALLAGPAPGPVRLALVKALAVLVASVVRLVTYRQVLFAAVHDEQRQPARRPALEGSTRLSVVVPAYQEQERIADSLERLRAAIEPEVSELELIVVDDGSSDETAARAAAGADLVLVQEVNRGKGAAVRRGALAARGRVVAFIDADLAYAPDQLLVLLERIEVGYDVVVGNRRHRDSVVAGSTSAVRDLGSAVFNLVTHLVLLGQYRDTQGGLKAFRRDVARLLFDHSVVDGFAFDVELLHLVERYQLTLAEVPVRLELDEGSTVSVARAAREMVSQVRSIRRRSAAGHYDLDRSVEQALAARSGL